jgi:hypothetical protein
VLGNLLAGNEVLIIEEEQQAQSPLLWQIKKVNR